jgi:hypothetical protein
MELQAFVTFVLATALGTALGNMLSDTIKQIINIVR